MMNIGICLSDEIDGFSIDGSFVSQLKDRYSQSTFIEFSSISDLEESVSECDLIVTWTFKSKWYSKASRLRAIFTPAAGYDWVKCDPNGVIPVFHGSFHGPLMAETLCGMMIYFNKCFEQLRANQHEHIWDRNFMSFSRRLGGQNIMIYGYGAIGRECARVLKTLGCTIWGVKRSARDPWLDRNADLIISPDDSIDFLINADHVVSILPGTSNNENFFGKRLWNAMNPKCYFYNLGRGISCKEADLLWALDNNKIAGAALDVFDCEPLPSQSRLWDYPGVFIMPHASSLCTAYMTLYLPELIQQLKPFVQ